MSTTETPQKATRPLCRLAPCTKNAAKLCSGANHPSIDAGSSWVSMRCVSLPRAEPRRETSAARVKTTDPADFAMPTVGFPQKPRGPRI
jgi:hypothetical protein